MNRSTKKNHELKKVDWDNMASKHKSLFDIIDHNDTEINIPVVGTVLKPNETQTKKRKNDN